MVRLLPVGIVVLLMVSALLYLRFFRSDNSPAALINSYQPVSGSPLSLADPSSGDLKQRVRDLEETVALLSQKLGNTKTTTPTPGGSVTSWGGVPEAKIKSLEDSVINLQKQIDSLKAVPGAVSANPPVYLSMGSGATLTDSVYASADGFVASLDPGDFPGYTGVQLEVTVRVSQPLGKGYVRLFNNTDNSAVGSSEVSTASDKSVVLTSGSFKLASGRKTYQLQAKTDNSYPFLLQNVRLKVTF